MTYVEWLRIRACLKWTAIVLMVCIGLTLFARFTYLDIRPHAHGFSGVFIDDQDMATFEHDSNVTESKLPDGGTRTIVDNPAKGIRMTIDDRGYWGKHVELYEATPPKGVHATKIDFGDIHAQRIMLPHGSLVKIDQGANVPEDLNYYFVFAALVAMIAATILGAPFARENEGHLEVALTRPISRVMLSLKTVAADLTGIVAAWAMTLISLFVAHTIFEAPNFFYGPTDTAAIALGLLAAFSWYALLNAATASMKRAYGAVLGIAWPVCLGIAGLSVSQLGDSPVAQFVHAVSATVARIDPLNYVHLGRLFTTAPHPTITTDLYVLAVLALVYGALAVIQWQRVEA
ncbi:MAG: hypothetical protein JO192_05670 [Candidatus Eremiobacteraeota bacterium]|nr:hypothetical protein [Candidatus Eremiobacteraeota bacterium]